MKKMEAFQSADGKVGLPDRMFKDKVTLFKGKESVDLYYFGAGHTNGDALVVFRDARVMRRCRRLVRDEGPAAARREQRRQRSRDRQHGRERPRRASRTSTR